ACNCASRPWNETTAWTVSFQNPRINLFVSGDNRFGSLVGRSFTEAVKERPHGIFYADTLREGLPLRRSVVEFDAEGVLESVENFYRQSEQRPARFFRCGNEDYALVAAQPGVDSRWLEELTAESVRRLDQAEELGLLEQRRYRWRCGCDEQKMLGVLMPVFRVEGESLFDGEATVRIQCPRCGARFVVTREALEAYMANVADSAEE
ncbi:MAG: Hsp33 family molecular chaperone HslO, partial [Verrucomicrobiia bacterium]